MSVILGKCVQLYHFLNDDISHPMTHDWFLMSNPFPGLAIIGLYLYVVLKWGPKYMEDKQPYSLKNTLIIYNALQIVACVYIVYQGIVLAWGNNYKFICEPCVEKANPLAIAIAFKFCYVYFIVKLVDLLDTVFFVMRKKQEQVTFLHVYHHTGMIMLSWGIVKWLPGGHGTFLILINSIIHIIMYSYYLLTAYSDYYKKSTWWKKYVTQIQIVQFAILMLHFLVVAFVEDCDYPVVPTMIMVPQNAFLFVLFCDFYRKAYMSKPKKIE